jgi:outer membrane protein TolC
MLLAPPVARAENDAGVLPLIKGEQRRIRYRDPSALPDVYVPATPPPPTVREPLPDDARQPLSLDDAIRMALANSEVVRQLAGNIAVSSGRTIYDPAITNTTIDEQRAAFDPTLSVNNTFTQTERPEAFFLRADPPPPPPPFVTVFGGSQVQNHNVSTDLSQTNMLGGVSRFSVFNDASRFSPGLFPLNPQNGYATELSYIQPLLRGAGVLANRVPIVLARIDTERSFFQLNDSLQELVRGVIEAYWSVVFARTDVWARDIQVRQAQGSLDFAEARMQFGTSSLTDVAQARSALAQFRANAIAARANLLSQEAALANILGLPPTEPFALVPTTPPTAERIAFDWNELVQVAQQRRPDLIELKLVIEADQQRLLLARNQQQPNLDLVGLYRWNGLEGQMPDLTRDGTNGNEATDWTLGVNFSVPLLLRQERAAVRSSELLVTRDRAALEQGIHSVRHILALNYRNLDQFYLQYQAFTESREAARLNLEQQFAEYRLGRPVLFINVLQAISDWGNSVSLQAQTLTQYNVELANLERATGTILETHGVFLYEDRWCSLGPLWIDGKRGRLYPRDIRPGENADRYPAGDEPAEQSFNLEDYPQRPPRMEEVPPPPGLEDVPGLEDLPGLEDVPGLEPLPGVEELPPTAPGATPLEFPPSVGRVEGRW